MYYNLVAQKEIETNKRWRLLTASFFIDEFMEYQTRKKKVLGIYMKPKQISIKVRVTIKVLLTMFYRRVYNINIAI